MHVTKEIVPEKFSGPPSSIAESEILKESGVVRPTNHMTNPEAFKSAKLTAIDNIQSAFNKTERTDLDATNSGISSVTVYQDPINKYVSI